MAPLLSSEIIVQPPPLHRRPPPCPSSLGCFAQVTDTEHLLDDLNSCNKAFNVIEKSLNEYLDSKKMLFPRWG